MPLGDRDVLREGMLGSAFVSPSKVGEAGVADLALFQSGLRRAVVVKDDIALPEHGPCAGHRVARLVAAFLVDCVPFLLRIALNEAQITIPDPAAGQRALILAFRRDTHRQIPVHPLAVVEID